MGELSLALIFGLAVVSGGIVAYDLLTSSNPGASFDFDL